MDKIGCIRMKQTYSDGYIKNCARANRNQVYEVSSMMAPECLKRSIIGSSLPTLFFILCFLFLYLYFLFLTSNLASYLLLLTSTFRPAYHLQLYSIIKI
jgi:hypothetical protein